MKDVHKKSKKIVLRLQQLIGMHHFGNEQIPLYGMNGAIILNQLAYSMLYNPMADYHRKNARKGDPEFVGGLYWEELNPEQLQKQFPYFSRLDIVKEVNKLIRKDVFVTKMCNDTVWARLNDGKAELGGARCYLK